MSYDHLRVLKGSWTEQPGGGGSRKGALLSPAESKTVLGGTVQVGWRRNSTGGNRLICSPLLRLKQMENMLANKINECDEKLAHMDAWRGLVWGIFSSL